MRKLVSKALVTSTLFLTSANLAAAAVTVEDVSGIGGAGQSDLISFVKETLNVVIGLAALVAVGILVYNGIQYMIANGDEGKIEKATKGITWAIIGLVIAFIAALIVNFVLTRILGQ